MSDLKWKGDGFIVAATPKALTPLKLLWECIACHGSGILREAPGEGEIYYDDCPSCWGVGKFYE